MLVVVLRMLTYWCVLRESSREPQGCAVVVGDAMLFDFAAGGALPARGCGRWRDLMKRARGERTISPCNEDHES